MNTQTFGKFAGVACMALVLAGCATGPTRVDQQFGNAVRAAVAAQTMNPEASRNTRPPAGLEGAAAGATMERYEKSFVSPPPPVNVFTIGIGNATGNATSGQ